MIVRRGLILPLLQDFSFSVPILLDQCKAVDVDDWHEVVAILIKQFLVVRRLLDVAQLNQFQHLEGTPNYVNIVGTATYMWKTIFALSKSVGDFTKPLTHKILSNPKHAFVKTIVYIYTMETFIY